MGDIWSNVGGSLPSTSQDWLYQVDGQIHGPVPKERIVQKLLSGDIDAKTMVAKEGGQFHPISQVATFAPHLEELGSKLDKQASKAKRNAIIVVVLILLAAGGGIGFYFKGEADLKAAKLAQDHEDEKARFAAAAKKNKELLAGDNVELVALVSFDESAMEVGGKAKPTRIPPRSGSRGGSDRSPRTPSKDTGPPPMVQECQRPPGEILGVLRNHLRNINTCVQDEKSRNPADLPPTLKLSFVAKPDGKVGDFEILDRHFKTGPMRNCMLKTFKLVKFNPTGGTNCPVTIPIKISG